MITDFQRHKPAKWQKMALQREPPLTGPYDRQLVPATTRISPFISAQRKRSKTLDDTRIEWVVASANLTRLDFDGVRQVHGTFHELSNRKVLPMLDVPPEHAGLHPLKAPCVFHCDDGIGSGDHAAEDEAAI